MYLCSSFFILKSQKPFLIIKKLFQHHMLHGSLIYRNTNQVKTSSKKIVNR